MPNLSWAEIKRRVFTTANGLCEYCLTSIANTGQAMHVEHIDPAKGNTLDNLCLSCANCNLSKATATTALDPITEQTVALFNPRIQQWDAHFLWNNDATEILGLTPIGRATVIRLKANRPRAKVARRRWKLAGLHPPD